jgi:hypothetical protein
MDTDRIYAAYVEYCRKLGIKPAAKDEYLRLTGKF